MSDRNLDFVRMVGGELQTVNNLIYRRRQRQCTHTQAVFIQETIDKNSSKMASSYFNISPIISIFVFFLFFTSSVCPALSSTGSEEYHQKNQTFRPGKQLRKLKAIRAHLMKINKPSLKTIQAFFSSPVLSCPALVFSIMGVFI